MATKNSFVLVKFIDTNEIEVTSSSWLRENDTKCVWPNYKNQNTTVKAISVHRKSEPHWTTHDIKLLGSGRKFAQYQEAVSKLPTLLVHSDAELVSDRELHRNQRKQKQSCQTVTTSHALESSDSEVEESEPSISPPPQMKRTGHCTNSHASSSRTINVLPLITTSPTKIKPRNTIEPYSAFCLGPVQSSPPGVRESSQTFPTDAEENSPAADDVQNTISSIDVSAPPASVVVMLPEKRPAPQKDTEMISDFPNWVVRNITIIKAQNRQIQETLDALLLSVNNSDSNATKSDTMEHKIPFKTKANVDEAMTVYDVSENRQSLVKHLSIRGGKDVSKCTRRVLAALCADSLASSYNWIGSRGEKIGFRDTWLKQVVLDSVQLSFSTRSKKVVADDEVEDQMKEWLKSAKKRLTPSGKAAGVGVQEQH